MRHLDTGIGKFVLRENPIDDIRKGIFERILVERGMDALPIPVGDGNIGLTRKDGRIFSLDLYTEHRATDTDAPILFRISDESDGTKRIMHLLPVLFAQAEKNAQFVFVIDELDRSLHTRLSRWFLETYLAACGEDSRVQMIYTTHDVDLLDQDLLRRDEIWFAERDPDGATGLVSLAEYKEVRNDTDLRRNYLLGRFGGVPNLATPSSEPA